VSAVEIHRETNPDAELMTKQASCYTNISLHTAGYVCGEGNGAVLQRSIVAKWLVLVFKSSDCPLHEYVTLAIAIFGAANSVKTLSNPLFLAMIVVVSFI